eukprot:TRINITY_DN2622_c0_g1_i2.p1 TRINITY_DN2622_c0_g1~~TRINITY_DN2622_c0_g1_i2.p1  ORF type:complete len:181 (-),score=22.13 TRINITY_DN2622_c0_g1_i2:738-1220(-)
MAKLRDHAMASSYGREWEESLPSLTISLPVGPGGDSPASPPFFEFEGKSGGELARITRCSVWWGLVVLYFYVAVMLAWKIDTMLAVADSHYDVAGTVGGALTCLTVPLAVYLMVLHLTNFVEPRQQSQIVRIIFMVPVYSVTAYLSLLHPQWALSITTVR